MLKRKSALRLFAVGAALVWCLLFMRCDTTDKSMIRAVLLERSEQQWTAGFLYQAPEAAADASEAVAEVAFCAARGQTLEQALAAAEKLLPQTANYRLCDYVLLAAGYDGTILDAYEQTLLECQCGRLSARVLRARFTSEQLSSMSEEVSALPEKLLQSVKQAAGTAPRLYEKGQSLVLPVLTLAQDGAVCEDEGVLWSHTRELVLTANQMQAALLLAGRGTGYVFEADGALFTVERAVCSVTPNVQDGFYLRFDCWAKPGTPKPASEQRQALAQLLAQTAALLWENGADVLGLRQTLAMHSGAAAAQNLSQNVCPPLQVDVRIYG